MTTQMFNQKSDRLAVFKVLEIAKNSNNLCAQALKKLIASGVQITVLRDKIKLPQCPVPSNIYTILAEGEEFIMARSPIPKSDNSPKAREFLYFVDNVLRSKSGKFDSLAFKNLTEKEQHNDTINKPGTQKIFRRRKIYQAGRSQS